jgi:predicted nucleic acid-binding protein
LRGIVLADTGPLYAARDPSDDCHGRTQDELGRLRTQNLKVVVPYPALLESFSLVMHKLGIREAHWFLDEVVGTSIFENATTEDYRKGSSRVLHYADQDITLVDAVIAEISARLAVPVWTFDHHFELMGTNVWR